MAAWLALLNPGDWVLSNVAFQVVVFPTPNSLLEADAFNKLLVVSLGCDSSLPGKNYSTHPSTNKHMIIVKDLFKAYIYGLP